MTERALKTLDGLQTEEIANLYYYALILKTLRTLQRPLDLQPIRNQKEQ